MDPLAWTAVVAELTSAAQEVGLDPAAWAGKVLASLVSAGVATPSDELAEVLVEHVCWGNNVPLAWKYLEKAVSVRLAPPVLVVSLLSNRVVASRHSKPAAYRLYMEIIKRHLFNFSFLTSEPNCERTFKSVDNVLHLRQVFGISIFEPGVLVLLFFFRLVWQLLDAALDDEGLLDLTPEKKSLWLNKPQDMEINGSDHFGEKRNDYSEKLQKANTVICIEIIWHLVHHKIISKLLSLARRNMHAHWQRFCQHLYLLLSKSLALRDSIVSPKILLQLCLGNINGIGRQYKPSQYKEFCAIPSGSLASIGGHIHGATHSALWVPFDLYLEDAINGSVAATNAIEDLKSLVKALRAVNRVTWRDAFLGLWISSLRLVQRGRDPIEGPIPHIATRMSMLLCITTLAVADLLSEEAAMYKISERSSTMNQLKEKVASGERHKALVFSLQVLGDYEELLAPPPSVTSAANQAASKAMMLVSRLSCGSGYSESSSMSDKAEVRLGNMRHLIVEACIARNILDTSAYNWPGYVIVGTMQMPHTMPGQASGWSALMDGVQFNSSVTAVMTKTPASSLAELTKIFEIAVSGSDDEKVAAATILCGASLINGWNIQEHTVRLVVNLLSPSPPNDSSGEDGYLINHGPIFNAILTRISSVDCTQIFSFHGLVPELAGSLMPICEIFGASMPDVKWTLSTGEEISAHAVFSSAFTLLLRLWRFNHPPAEYCVMGDGAPVGSQLTPEYLLLLRNSQVSSTESKNRNGGNANSTAAYTRQSIFLDSFPKLKAWYRQHQACLASTLSGLVPGTPVHNNVDILLTMMLSKINKGSNQSVGPVVSSSSSLSNSSCPTNEDTTSRPKLPAWDILEAVPFVVDAALTACSHGKLFPRELATGLKDMADFLPASLAAIASYFSAEVTRGVWKHVHMNGTDWPSPAANLSTIEEHIKKILAATGVDVPSLVTASCPATLPLPLAAFVSLTITYKLDRSSERFLNLAGPTMGCLASSCPWPSMPIVAALWAQKVKRWNDYLIFSASSTVFHHNNDAVVQLLKSCFSAILGLSLTDGGGVGGLLGHGFGSHHCGGLSPVAPGVLYLEIHRDIRDIMLLAEQILSLLIETVREIAGGNSAKETKETLKSSKYRTSYGHVSVVSALTRVRVAASLGSTLICLSGGSGLVRYLFREMLPSWFLSHASDRRGNGGMVAMLEGYGLAYFAILCGMFAWNADHASVKKRRSNILSSHLEFLVDALDGKISLGCSPTTCRAYVSGFLGLMVDCSPSWVLEMDLDLLKRLSRGLKQWNEDELAILLLSKAGIPAMGAAAELILAGE